MTARTRKKPPLHTPPVSCQIAGCGQEYAAIGTYKETQRAAELGGWLYRIFGHNGRRYVGDWLCPGHKDWLPGCGQGATATLALPVREPGGTRAVFLGVVPPLALPAPPEVLLPPVDGGPQQDAPRPGRSLSVGDQAGNMRPGALGSGPGGLPPLPHRQPGVALAAAQADDAQHDAEAFLLRCGGDPAEIASITPAESGEQP
jgi:hypothetical protein